jgi:hypothetical protein
MCGTLTGVPRPRRIGDVAVVVRELTEADMRRGGDIRFLNRFDFLMVAVLPYLSRNGSIGVWEREETGKGF